ncbi:MAG TPA: DUF2231 domain-containing protein [Acidobacteriota bacterium]|nr:DUF2231 domain-containing protein [Acidobacteriota bacterium]
MIESILSKTNLPNLHPAMVHFPIVLLLVALLIDMAALFFSSRDWLRKSALMLTVLGTLTAFLTFWSGREAAETVSLTAAAEGVLTRHENSAEYTLWFFGVYTTIRLVLQAVSYKRWIHAVMIFLGLAGQYLLIQTADLGGTLVYKHAVAVKVPEAKLSADRESPISKDEVAPDPLIDGNHIQWDFGNGSEQNISEVFQVLSGSLDQVKISSSSANGKTFLNFQKESKDTLILVFQPILEDTQIEAEVNLTEFQGTFALVHHASKDQFDYLAITGTKLIVLGRKKADADKTFAKKESAVPNDFISIKAVGAGTHFRGYINDAMVVHGHGEAASKGQAGILLEGTGRFAMSRIEVTPISNEAH